MTYDDWKSTDPRDREPHWTTCPVCKEKHWEHEDCPDDLDGCIRDMLGAIGAVGLVVTVCGIGLGVVLYGFT